jgi:hypothetical protein
MLEAKIAPSFRYRTDRHAWLLRVQEYSERHDRCATFQAHIVSAGSHAT